MSAAQVCAECGGVMLADTETWARPLCWEHWEFRERVISEERGLAVGRAEVAVLVKVLRDILQWTESKTDGDSMAIAHNAREALAKVNP